MNKTHQLLFLDYLKKLPPAVLFSCLGEKNQTKRILSLNLLKRLTSHFLTEDNIHNRYHALSSEAKKICFYIYLTKNEGLLVNPQIAPFCDELQKSFLIYIMKDDNKRSYIFGFHELTNFIRTTILKQSTSEKAQTYISTASFSPVHDFMVFLSATLNGHISILKSDQLSQQSITRLRDTLQYGKEKPEDISQIGHFFYQFARAQHLFTVSDGNIQASITVYIQWLYNKNSQDILNLFYEFSYEYLVPWDRSFCLDPISENRIPIFSQVLFPTTLPLNLVLTKLNIFNYLSLIDYKDSENRWCHLVTEDLPTPKYGENLTILPDLTAIIPQEISPQGILSFSIIGTIERFDQVYSGKIDKNVIHSSLSKGILPEKITDLLNQWHCPPNVIQNIQGWINEFLRITYIDTATIISNDPRTSQQITQYPPLQELITPINADQIFRIHKGSEKQVQSILESMGFDTRDPYEIVKLCHDDINDKKTLSQQKQNAYIHLDTTFSNDTVDNINSIRTGKYSVGLKELDTHELLHVIDYAILMGEKLCIDYCGSEGITQGIYTITPLKQCYDAAHSIEAEAHIDNEKVIKQFVIKDIYKIGVISQ